jgi:hypothetical protein
MARKGKGSRPEVSAIQRFGELLSWHLDRGTRPGGSPDAEGVRWTVKEFAAAVGADERSVRAWRGGNYLLKDLHAIEKQLFGDNPAYREAIDKLRRLHREARSGVRSAELALDSTLSGSGTRLESWREAELENAPSGLESTDLSEAEFREAVAGFVIGAGRVMLVSHPEMVLLGFRGWVNRMMAVERADSQTRILIWTLDPGKHNFDDLDSRLKFLNVESLASRFRALKRFKEEVAKARWDWLQSRVIIALHDTSSGRPEMSQLPDFDPQHILFSAIPPRWAETPNFRALYGHERLQETVYSIFLRRSAIESTRENAPSGSASSDAGRRHEFRYFGHAVVKSEETGEPKMTGLELVAPGRAYVEALGTLFAAAAQVLGLRNLSGKLSIDGVEIDPHHAIQKLHHHGFRLLHLDEFLMF